MNIRDINEQEYADLFPVQGVAPQKPNFGTVTESTGDIFSPSSTDTTTASASDDSTTETTTVESTTETTTVQGEENETGDILSEAKPKGRKPKYTFDDISGYFEDRINSGKFVAIEQDGENGEPVKFVPKTPEEFDEVIDIQVNYQLEQKKKELEQSWYESKSPAWRAIAKYAELTDDPSQVLPFIQGVKTIDSVASVDENAEDGAEMIVRTRLEQRGEPNDVIDEQIEVLKSSDKLISTAQKYKPLILQQERANLAQMVQYQEQEEQKYQELVENIREKAVESIESPIFGNKLTREEKAEVYKMIAVPDEQSQGYPIYQEIDSLFESGDFDTLRMVALLLRKKDSLINYISNNAAHKTAETIQKRIRVADSSRGSTGNDEVTGETRPSVKRNQYTGAVRFGRQ